MTLNPAFLEMMPSTVTVFPQSSRDAYGKQTFAGTGTVVRCRVVPTNDVIRDANGREVVASGRVLCYGTPAVTVDSRLLLPDGSDAIVVAVQVQNDEDGAHHTVVTFGRV